MNVSFHFVLCFRKVLVFSLAMAMLLVFHRKYRLADRFLVKVFLSFIYLFIYFFGSERFFFCWGWGRAGKCFFFCLLHAMLLLGRLTPCASSLHHTPLSKHSYASVAIGISFLLHYITTSFNIL